ncbi:unnamed protein product, partial [Ixodes persulcatus]
ICYLQQASGWHNSRLIAIGKSEGASSTPIADDVFESNAAQALLVWCKISFFLLRTVWAQNQQQRFIVGQRHVNSCWPSPGYSVTRTSFVRRRPPWVANSSF